jgi:hypothetical protein
MPKISARDGVFETNSSSSHSVTIAENEMRTATFPADMLRAGRIDVRLGQYGWEWMRYYKPETKLAYLLTQVNGNHSKMLEICRTVEKHTGCKVVIDPVSAGSSYVDHESHGNGYELTQDSEKLIDFLLSENSYIQTGNDNSPAGELIDTDRGPEEAHVQHYAEKIEHETSFRIRFDNEWKDILFESGDVRIETTVENFRLTWGLDRLFEDTIVTAATVSPTAANRTLDKGTMPRDLVHALLAGINRKDHQEFPLRILRDAPIEVGNAPEGPMGRTRPVTSTYDATYDLHCSAPPSTIQNFTTRIGEIAEASRTPAPN